ncbi:MAG: minor capsid protein [Oscillospiraceae bacterium]|jgi:SPP1 gp7 family putative phage head morphogenesis protein|nr:minor capsid protein [Oscillospiraceae bacterium]
MMDKDNLKGRAVPTSWQELKDGGFKFGISKEEYDRLLKQIAQVTGPEQRRILQARASSAAYSWRMGRQEALQTSVSARLARLSEAELKTDTEFFRKLIPQAHGRTLYDLQRGTRMGFSFSSVSDEVIREIMKNPWSGENYSERVWKNKQALEDALVEDVTAGFLSGKSYEQTARDIADRMGVGYSNAERLVRTESNYMANAAEIEGYKSAGIERYRFLAILDGRTSPACQDHDGKTYAVSEAKAGVNLPPLHPWCRSTTTMALDDETLAGMKRRAKDPVTGEEKIIPANMDYKEWMKWVEAGSPADVEEWRAAGEEHLLFREERIW